MNSDELVQNYCWRNPSFQQTWIQVPSLRDKKTLLNTDNLEAISLKTTIKNYILKRKFVFIPKKIEGKLFSRKIKIECGLVGK